MTHQTQIIYSVSQESQEDFSLKYCPNAKGVFKAICECGAVYYIVAGCNKEICSYCGLPNSPLHRQTFRRWIGKVKWLFLMRGYIGYTVVTLPLNLRYLDRQFLNDVAKKIIVILQKYGAKYIRARWHWSGERSKIYHPHLNIISDVRYVENIRETLTREIERVLGVNNIVLEHHYYCNWGQVIHKIKYITRPTLLLIENEDERNRVWELVVKGFRNCYWRGKWQEYDINQSDIMVAINEAEEEGDWRLYVRLCLDANLCPNCHRKLQWIWERCEIFEFLEFFDRFGCYFVKSPP